MHLGMELGMKLFLWSVALLPPSASFKVLLKTHCKDSHLTPIDKSVVKMAFNRVLLCCIQNVNNTLGLYLGGGWKHLAVLLCPSQLHFRDCRSPSLLGTEQLCNNPGRFRAFHRRPCLHRCSSDVYLQELYLQDYCPSLPPCRSNTKFSESIFFIKWS